MKNLKKLSLSVKLSDALRDKLHDKIEPLLQVYQTRRTIVHFCDRAYFT